MSYGNLEAELQHLKQLNATVDMLVSTAKVTLKNIQTVKSVTDSTAALLEDWVRILNQTQFTRSALQDRLWKGPEEDIEPETYSLKEAELEAELRELEVENERLAANLDSLHKSENSPW